MRRKALTMYYFVMSIYTYQAYGFDSECQLEGDGQSAAELFQERENLLSAIAADVAKYIEVPYLPPNAETFLEGTMGALLKVVATENKWQNRNLKRSGKKEIESLNELVLEIKDIRNEVSEFNKKIYSFDLEHQRHEHFIAAIKMYLNDTGNKYKDSMNLLVGRLDKTKGLSKMLYIPRESSHFCFGVGVSRTNYLTVIKSPLFFSYACSQRSWSPKFGLALAFGSNGFQITDNLVETYGKPDMVFHPDHPYSIAGKKGRVSFNWEGSFFFLEGAKNTTERFGTGGLSPLPFGFSIGPEFTSEVKAHEFTTTHDTWKFYKLLGISQFLAI